MADPNTTLYVLLIKVDESVRTNSSLRSWINEIHDDYMERFGDLGASLAHVALEDPDWHFALVFPGTDESVQDLRDAIERKAPEPVTFKVMRGTDLDIFRQAEAR